MPEVVVTMPTPPLDCGCPAQAAYTYRRHTTTLELCAHHGRAGKVAAIRQGFVVSVVKAGVPA